MHIINLEAENVKRLQAVTIEPNGNMVVIGGPNGAGKSSVLDCIEYALGGKKHLPEIPLRQGTDHGHIILQTDKYTVTRTFTETESYIKVTTPEGYKIGTPQELLDKLVGDLSFDPLAFTRLDAKKQAEMFRSLLGLDFSKLDAEYQQVEADRRDIGRDVKNHKSMLELCPVNENPPVKEIVVSELITELEKRRNINKDNALKISNRDAVSKNVQEIRQKVAALRAELDIAENSLRAELDKLSKANEFANSCVDAETESVIQQINEAESINKRFRDAQKRVEYQVEYDKFNKEYESKTARLRKIEATKNEMISNAKFPVEGVAFSDTGILVHGIPFEQASSAEQLRIAVAMGLSSNPDLRVVLIRDGSLLDESSLSAVADMAKEYDADVWMERVGDGAEVSIVIQDGKVFENRIQAQEAEEVA